MDGKVVVLECFSENGVSENEVKFQFNGKLIKLRLDLLGLRQFCPFIIIANLFSLVHFFGGNRKKNPYQFSLGVEVNEIICNCFITNHLSTI